MTRLDQIDKVHREYAQQSNATIKMIETKIGQLSAQLQQRNGGGTTFYDREEPWEKPVVQGNHP